MASILPWRAVGVPRHQNPGVTGQTTRRPTGQAACMAVVRRTLTAVVVLIALLLALGIGVGAVQQSGLSLPVGLSPAGLSLN
jgi:hypothetical protein